MSNFVFPFQNSHILHPCIKASAHSFKRFTSRLLKLSFSLYAPIISDECHGRFHLNAASPAARNTEQLTEW